MDDHLLIAPNTSRAHGSEQEADFRCMVENSLDLIIKINLSGHYTYVNPAFCALYDTCADELLGRHYSQDVVEEDRVMVNEFFNKLFIYPHIVTFVHRENTANGVRRLEWTGKGLTNNQGKLVEFIGVARDVTERFELIDRLELQANYDDLTGIANRRFFVQQAHLEFTRAKRYHYPLSLFMLDIDHFKQVNDQHGHLSGDLVLKKLSHLMQFALREYDLIGRVGGEEYAVLLPQTSLEDAIMIAERLRQKVEKNTFEVLNNQSILLTISIGVISSTEMAHDFENLWRESDVRLYKAKSSGRNQIFPSKF